MMPSPDYESSPNRTCEDQLILWARICCLISVTIFLASLVGIKYVTNDDIWQSAWRLSGDWFAAGHHLAVIHGRLFKPASIALFVPYAFDNPVYYAITYLGPIVVAALLAARLVRVAVPVVGMACLFLLLFFAFAQNSFDHNLFSAVPFVWEAAWGMILSGALLLHRAIGKQKISIAIVGALFVLLGMIEALVPFALLFLVIAQINKGGLRRNALYLLPYAVVMVVWMGAWLWWRNLYPSQYEGSSFGGDISPTRILRTIWTYGIGGAPFSTIWNDTAVATLATFKEGFGVKWVVKAIAVAAGLLFLARIFARQASGSISIKYFVGVLVFAFLPVALLGLTPKYQEWVQNGSHAYVYSHFSYFAWIALVAMLFVRLVQYVRSEILFIVLAIAGGTGSLLADWSNYETNFQQKLSARKWETFDHFLESRAYENVAGGSRVYYVGLDVARGIAATDPSYWTYYSRVRTGKEVQFVSDIEGIQASPNPTYLLLFEDESRGYTQSVIFAKIEFSDEGALLTREFSFLLNTRNDWVGVSGRHQTCRGIPCDYQIAIGNEVENNSPFPEFSLRFGTGQCDVCEFDGRSSPPLEALNIRLSYNRQVRPRLIATDKNKNNIFKSGFQVGSNADSANSK